MNHPRDNKLSKHQSSLSYARAETRWCRSSAGAERRAYSRACRQSARAIIEAELDIELSDAETSIN